MQSRHGQGTRHNVQAASASGSWGAWCWSDGGVDSGGAASSTLLWVPACKKGLTNKLDSLGTYLKSILRQSIVVFPPWQSLAHPTAMYTRTHTNTRTNLHTCARTSTGIWFRVDKMQTHSLHSCANISTQSQLNPRTFHSFLRIVPFI